MNTQKVTLNDNQTSNQLSRTCLIETKSKKKHISTILNCFNSEPIDIASSHNCSLGHKSKKIKNLIYDKPNEYSIDLEHEELQKKRVEESTVFDDTQTLSKRTPVSTNNNSNSALLIEFVDEEESTEKKISTMLKNAETFIRNSLETEPNVYLELSIKTNSLSRCESKEQNSKPFSLPKPIKTAPVCLNKDDESIVKPCHISDMLKKAEVFIRNSLDLKPKKPTVIINNKKSVEAPIDNINLMLKNAEIFIKNSLNLERSVTKKVKRLPAKLMNSTVPVVNLNKIFKRRHYYPRGRKWVPRIKKF